MVGWRLPSLLAGAAQGHPLIDGHVAPDLGRLADDDARTVVDEQSLADGRPGVDLDLSQQATDLGDEPGRERHLTHPQCMGHPMEQNGM